MSVCFARAPLLKNSVCSLNNRASSFLIWDTRSFRPEISNLFVMTIAWKLAKGASRTYHKGNLHTKTPPDSVKFGPFAKLLPRISLSLSDAFGVEVVAWIAASVAPSRGLSAISDGSNKRLRTTAAPPG